MKPKIGIVPSRTVNQTRPFKDVFTFVNNPALAKALSFSPEARI